MPSLQKYIMLCASAGLMMMSFVGDTSASTMGMNAKISFVRVVTLNKHSDVTFGSLQPRPNDKLSVGTDGNLRLVGNGDVLSTSGSPSIISLGDTRDTVMNFIPGNYVAGQGITSLQAHCVLKNNLGADCASHPMYGQKESTLLIGMDVTVGDLSAAPTQSPSFDMSVVYQ